MPRHKYIVGRATYNTKQRMKEIHFFFIIKQLSLYHKRNIRLAKEFNYYLENIIENFCQIYQIKISTIKYAMNRMHHVHYKPTHLEVGLASKYLDIPFKIAVALGKVSNRVVYRELEKYITQDGHYELLPKFDVEVIIELERFNKAFTHMFKLSNHLCVISEDTYDSDEEDIYND